MIILWNSLYHLELCASSVVFYFYGFYEVFVSWCISFINVWMYTIHPDILNPFRYAVSLQRVPTIYGIAETAGSADSLFFSLIRLGVNDFSVETRLVSSIFNVNACDVVLKWRAGILTISRVSLL